MRKMIIIKVICVINNDNEKSLNEYKISRSEEDNMITKEEEMKFQEHNLLCCTSRNNPNLETIYLAAQHENFPHLQSY